MTEHVKWRAGAGTMPLSEDPLFRRIVCLTLCVPLLVVGCIISLNVGKPWFQLCFEPDCWNRLLEYFRVPIALLSAGFAIAGLYALVHRSQQTAIQINAAQANSTFSNYIAHKKDFGEMISNLEREFPQFSYSQTGLYVKLFPHNNPKTMSYTPLLADDDETIVARLARLYNDLVNAVRWQADLIPSGDVPKGVLEDILRKYFNLQLHLGLNAKQGVPADMKFALRHGDNTPDISQNLVPFDIVGCIRVLERILTALVFFCSPHDPPASELLYLDDTRDIRHLNSKLDSYILGKS